MLDPTQIGVELVTRNESGSYPAGDRLEFVVTDQCANGVLGAAELGGNLADCQRFRPFHAPEYGSSRRRRVLTSHLSALAMT